MVALDRLRSGLSGPVGELFQMELAVPGHSVLPINNDVRMFYLDRARTTGVLRTSDPVLWPKIGVGPQPLDGSSLLFRIQVVFF